MGELILCRQPIAATPYYIDEISQNIYSLEEMSYYIAHNVYLLNNTFMSVDLCNWIGRELGQKELEHQLLDFMKNNAPLHIFIGHLLSATGYLTAGEIKELLIVIASFENKSETECRKMRADRLMDKGKLIDAIYEYENLIDSKPEKDVSIEFLGDIWHNLGTAYAKLFFFEEAGMCFEMAYQRNRKDISMRSMLFAFRCGHYDDRYNDVVARYFIPEDVSEEIREEASKVSQKKEIVSFDEHLNGLKSRYDSHDSYVQQLNRQLEQWKESYTGLCKI